MDILQKILNAITTPNEGLFNIIGIPLTYLDAFVFMYFYTTVLNIKTTNKRKLIYVLIYGTFANLINFIVPASYTVFINLIVWPVMVFFILKATVLKSILSEVITFVLTSTLEFICSNVAFEFFNITMSQLMTVPLYRTLCVTSIYLLIYLITLVIKYFKVNIKVFDNMSKRTKILLIANLVLMVFVIGTQFYLIRYYSNTMPGIITFIDIFGLIAYFAISIYCIVGSSKLEMTTRDLEGTKLNLHSLQVLHDTVRTFKHDFDNIVNGIGGYIRNNDMEGLTRYYTELQEDCNKTNNLYSLNPKVINQPAIYNILATKYYDADEQNIQINLDIFLDLNEIEQHMKIYDFTRILGILLDNAIEASKECEEKIINVSFRKENSRHRILVIIENTYNNKDVDTEKIFEKGISSKSKETNSGLGLWKVRQILKRNNNLNLFTSKTSDMFKQQFEIYY